jgi:glycosyltransferase involved in cell wall biosynthesis
MKLMQKRILHIVGGMNRGGIETWLMHVLRHIDRHQFRMDFLVHTQDSCSYDDEILDLGSKVLQCPYHSNPWQYAQHFQKLMRENGPYDIAHSHVHHYSGFPLLLAQKAKIPVRIAHSHNNTISVDSRSNMLRKGYLALMHNLIQNCATIGLACSQSAAESLYDKNWRDDPRWQLLYYGMDFSQFHQDINALAIRTELDIPSDAMVVGHVGRFVEQKNHDFFIEIASEIIQREPKSHFLMVGEGELKVEMVRKIEQSRLGHVFTILGTRSDIPKIMCGAMDAFLFPSHYEGLGLVLLEAQAAGLPCIFSDTIPTEVDVVHPLVNRLSLSQPASKWAEFVLQNFSRDNIPRTKALQSIENSLFSIQKSVENLSSIYCDLSINRKFAA